MGLSRADSIERFERLAAVIAYLETVVCPDDELLHALRKRLGELGPKIPTGESKDAIDPGVYLHGSATTPMKYLTNSPGTYVFTESSGVTCADNHQR